MTNMSIEEFEKCVSCGKITDVPKMMVVQKRENYLEGAGQLCRECGYRFRKENNKKRKNDMGV